MIFIVSIETSKNIYDVFEFESLKLSKTCNGNVLLWTQNIRRRPADEIQTKEKTK